MFAFWMGGAESPTGVIPSAGQRIIGGGWGGRIIGS